MRVSPRDTKPLWHLMPPIFQSIGERVNGSPTAGGADKFSHCSGGHCLCFSRSLFKFYDFPLSALSERPIAAPRQPPVHLPGSYGARRKSLIGAAAARRPAWRVVLFMIFHSLDRCQVPAVCGNFLSSLSEVDWCFRIDASRALWCRGMR